MKPKYRVKITLSGYLLIGITLAIGLAGANTGNNLLYLSASALLALMTVSGFLSFLNLAFLKAEIEAPEEIFAGLPAPFRLKISGPPYPCFFIQVETPYGQARLSYFRKSAKALLWQRIPRRGRQSLGFLAFSSGYPLGFFVRTRFKPLALTVTVYPQPLPGPVPFKEKEPKPRGYRRSGGVGEAEELVGLRPYREGEPAARIAWRASARRGKLLAKEFEGPAGKTLLIDLGRGFTEEDLGRATYLILSAFKEDLAVGLRLPGKEIPPGRGASRRRKLLEALAYA